MNRPTARDVAELAGVSRRRRVLRLQRAGGGEPGRRHPAEDQERGGAAGLPARRGGAARCAGSCSAVIGLLSDEIATSPFAGRMVLGAMEAAREQGHQVLLLESRLDPAAEAGRWPSSGPGAWTASCTRRCRCAVRLSRRASTPHGWCSPTASRRRRVRTRRWWRTSARAAGQPSDVLIEEGPPGDRAMLRWRAGRTSRPATGPTGFRGRDAGRGHRRPRGPAGRLAAGEIRTRGPPPPCGCLDSPDRPTGLVCANNRVATSTLLAAAQLAHRRTRRTVGSSATTTRPRMASASLVPEPLTNVALPQPRHRRGGGADHASSTARRREKDINPYGARLLAYPVVKRDSIQEAPPTPLRHVVAEPRTSTSYIPSRAGFTFFIDQPPARPGAPR